jgi:hypothetical protein
MSHAPGEDAEARLIEEIVNQLPAERREEFRRFLSDPDAMLSVEKGSAQLKALASQLSDLRSERRKETAEAADRLHPGVHREPVLIAFVSELPPGLSIPASVGTRAVIVRDPSTNPKDNILILQEEVTIEAVVGGLEAIWRMRERSGEIPLERWVVSIGDVWEGRPIDRKYSPEQVGRFQQWTNDLRDRASGRFVAGIGSLRRALVLTPALR